MNIKLNDTVVMLHGKDRGKQGKVTRAYPSKHRVLIEKINVVKKHIKPTQNAPKGGIIEVERPVTVAKVMLVCPHCNKPTRIGHSLSKDGKNVRICKKCNQALDA